MIPTTAQLQELSRLKEGELSKYPFAVLLRALAENERTAVLEIRRRQLYKRIVFEYGVLVDCQSNLVHEVLGRFMVSQGRITSEQSTEVLNESLKRGVQYGEVLVDMGILKPVELFRVLQQNLAKKLLDCFTWQEGEFRMLFDIPDVSSPLKVNVHQLILTGLGRFAPQEEIDVTVMTLIGKRLGLHPRPPVSLLELKLTGAQQKLVNALAQPKAMSELAGETGLPIDEVSRLVYALGILGLVGTDDVLREVTSEISAEAVAAVAAGPARHVRAPEIGTEEIMQRFLAHRRQDAFDLLGLPEDAGLPAIRERYMARAREVAPWSFTDPAFEGLHDKAEDLYLSYAQAYSQLADVERRNDLVFRRKMLREQKERDKKIGPERIKTDLLDSEAQYRKGRLLMDGGEFKEAIQYVEFASDCDPQNGLYRAELAYCRYVNSPSLAEQCLDDLREACRIDPRCGLAVFYTGEILRDLQRYDDAEPLLREAIKMMAPDRRPIDALKALSDQRKGKRRPG